MNKKRDKVTKSDEEKIIFSFHLDFNGEVGACLKGTRQELAEEATRIRAKRHFQKRMRGYRAR